MSESKRDDYEWLTLRDYRGGEYLQILELCGSLSKREKRKANIIIDAHDHEHISKIASTYHLTNHEVASVIKAFNARGIRALRNKPRTVTPSIKNKILVAWKAKPRNLGYSFDKWTLRRLRGHLKVQQNITVCLDTLQRVTRVDEEDGTTEGLGGGDDGPAGTDQGPIPRNGKKPAEEGMGRKAQRKAIPENPIDLIRLRLMGYDVRQIAEMVGVSRSTVRRRLLPFLESKSKGEYLAQLQGRVGEAKKPPEVNPEPSASGSLLPNMEGDPGLSKIPAPRVTRLGSHLKRWNDFLEAYPGRIESMGKEGIFLIRPDQFQKRIWLSFRYTFDCRPPGMKEELPDFILLSAEFDRFIAEKERQIHALSQNKNPKVQAILKTWWSKDEGETLQRLQDHFLLGLRSWNDSIINWFLKERVERRHDTLRPSRAGRPGADWLNILLLFFDNELMGAYRSVNPILRENPPSYKRRPYIKDLAVLFNVLFPDYIRRKSPIVVFNRLRHFRLQGLDQRYRKKGVPIILGFGPEEAVEGLDIAFTPPLRSLNQPSSRAVRKRSGRPSLVRALRKP